jgi:NADPH:quinone reductase-like Zn-dependent oxidoreductase
MSGSTTIQAIRAHDYGGTEVLLLEQVPRPEPQRDQVLIRVKAAGVDPVDWKMRAGFYRQFMPLTFPWTPGIEAAGTVEAIGPEVTNFHIGQDVYGIVAGGYAEYALASAQDIQPKPLALSFDEAASVPVGALTAWQAVIEKADVQEGQRVLVQGAAGGVGVWAVQLSLWKGAQVIGTASTSNVNFLRSLGVDTVIDYTSTAFETVVRDVDAVIDTVGGDLPDRSWQVLCPGGILVTIAARLPEDAGEKHGVRATRSGRASGENLKMISELIESGKAKPVVGTTFPLANAAKAQELSQTGHGRGRIILHIAD